MRILLLTLALFTARLSFADAWDNLTKQQAEKVVKHLEANPYIFDYCDCCGDGKSMTLLKVTKTSIVPCDWDAGSFTVKVEATAMVSMKRNEFGLDVSSFEKAEPQEDQLTIYMNYTWVYFKEKKSAAPVFSSIKYDKYGKKKPCEGLFKFPDPKSFKKIFKDKSYKKWFKLNC